jgi:hypothetical protein
MAANLFTTGGIRVSSESSWVLILFHSRSRMTRLGEQWKGVGREFSKNENYCSDKKHG